MTYFSEHFYWRPCKGKYNSSVHLYVEDGWKINLDLDDCKAEGDPINCECGYENTALSQLTKEELINLRDSMSKAVEYLEYREKK